MKLFLHFTILIILSFLLISCQNDDNNDSIQQVCNNSNSNFSNLYDDIVINEDLLSYDTVESSLHAYVFKVSSQKQICSIGYQSFHEDVTVPYGIIIKEEATNTILYSGNHLFTQNNMSYVNLSQNIILEPNTEYVISRIQNMLNNDSNNSLGTVIDGISNGNIEFLPYTFNELSILSTRFIDIWSDDEVDVYNFLPKIDIVFIE
ncbi:hypothetical protein [Xanthomarina sp. GH4-25]|uniref:hypothetical protein n=1 Tax=Xanthomarina sp. GH4-25 TaxID=3349335 RepID=UPI000F4DFAB9